MVTELHQLKKVCCNVYTCVARSDPVHATYIFFMIYYILRNIVTSVQTNTKALSNVIYRYHALYTLLYILNKEARETNEHVMSLLTISINSQYVRYCL